MKFPELAGRTFAFDTETPNLNWERGTIPFGISMSFDTGCGFEDYYWDIRKTPRVVDYLKAELPRANRIIAHRAQFDAQVTYNLGVRNIDHLFDCTMIRGLPWQEIPKCR